MEVMGLEEEEGRVWDNQVDVPSEEEVPRTSVRSNLPVSVPAQTGPGTCLAAARQGEKLLGAS